MGSQRHAPVALVPGKTRYPQNRKMDGPRGLGPENLAPTGVQIPDRPTVANRSTDYAMPATIHITNVLALC